MTYIPKVEVSNAQNQFVSEVDLKQFRIIREGFLHDTYVLNLVYL